MKKSWAFTLAEVLIVLGLLGIVAESTIPTLITNVTDKAWAQSITIFDMKLNEAMNQMKTNNEMTGYDTNEKFVDALSRYLRINKRCDASNLTKCFPATVYASDGKPVDTVAKLRTGKDFGKATYTAPLTGVQFANGTSALIAYDPACEAADAYNNQEKGSKCLSILYDVNGFSKPNKAGRDIKMFNVDKIGLSCSFESGGTCFGAPFYPTPISYAQCMAQKDTYGISTCFGDNDYWAGAAIQCGGVSKMLTLAQMGELTNEIYGVSCGTDTDCYGSLNYTKAAAHNLPASGTFYLWGADAVSGGFGNAYNRYFTSTSSSGYFNGRSASYNMTFCAN